MNSLKNTSILKQEYRLFIFNEDKPNIPFRCWSIRAKNYSIIFQRHVEQNLYFGKSSGPSLWDSLTHEIFLNWMRVRETGLYEQEKMRYYTSVVSALRISLQGSSRCLDAPYDGPPISIKRSYITTQAAMKCGEPQLLSLFRLLSLAFRVFPPQKNTNIHLESLLLSSKTWPSSFRS